MEYSPEETLYQSWFIDLLRQSRIVEQLHRLIIATKENIANLGYKRKARIKQMSDHEPAKKQNLLWSIIIFCILSGSSWFLLNFIFSQLSGKEIIHVLLLGAATALRVIILIILSSIIWIPVGVFIGLKPHLAQKTQPILQFLAAFPANLLYPLFVIVIFHFNLNVEIWLTPLMILGSQWYILFNIIAGAANIPRDLYLAANNLGLTGWMWWKRLALPAIFPFYLTGAITAAGGAWNASIVAELVSWGDVTLKATGLGEYIQASTLGGQFSQVALGTTIMCLYVLAFNHLLWRPLYKLTEDKFTMH